MAVICLSMAHSVTVLQTSSPAAHRATSEIINLFQQFKFRSDLTVIAQVIDFLCIQKKVETKKLYVCGGES